MLILPLLLRPHLRSIPLTPTPRLRSRSLRLPRSPLGNAARSGDYFELDNPLPYEVKIRPRLVFARSKLVSELTTAAFALLNNSTCVRGTPPADRRSLTIVPCWETSRFNVSSSFAKPSCFSLPKRNCSLSIEICPFKYRLQSHHAKPKIAIAAKTDA